VKKIFIQDTSTPFSESDEHRLMNEVKNLKDEMSKFVIMAEESKQKNTKTSNNLNFKLKSLSKE